MNPTSPSDQSPSHTSSLAPPTDRLTADMIDSLRATKPWVRFLSILGFIGAGFMMLIALFMVGFGMLGGGDAEMPGIFLAGMGFLYLLMAVLYIFPSLYLFRYASAIQRALDPGPKVMAVQDALRYQKSFWKFMGILALVTMLLYIPGVLAAIAVPNFLTAMQRAKQKRTMADIRTIATAVESYAVDHNEYPPGPMDALPALLVPEYVESLPQKDGWDRPFTYTGLGCHSGRCQEYFIASGGKDGVLDLDPSTVASRPIGPISDFNGDIAYMNGQYISWPEKTP